MRFILTALIFLAGLADLMLGIAFFLQPADIAREFGLAPVGEQGLAVLRADMTAFFVVAAGCMMGGAWRRNGDLLLPPLGLFAIAFIGRLLSAAVDGIYPQFWLPMLAEGFHVILLAAAWRILPHHRIDEIAG
jgi:hypothetical protein